jgi:hypothetical protein
MARACARTCRAASVHCSRASNHAAHRVAHEQDRRRLAGLCIRGVKVPQCVNNKRRLPNQQRAWWRTNKRFRRLRRRCWLRASTPHTVKARHLLRKVSGIPLGCEPAPRSAVLLRRRRSERADLRRKASKAHAVQHCQPCGAPAYSCLRCRARRAPARPSPALRGLRPAVSSRAAAEARAARCAHPRRDRRRRHTACMRRASCAAWRASAAARRKSVRTRLHRGVDGRSTLAYDGKE